MNPNNIRRCGHCGNTYDWRRSPSSSLKMTYCGALCERADLGFTIEGLLKVEAQGPRVAERDVVEARQLPLLTAA